MVTGFNLRQSCNLMTGHSRWNLTQQIMLTVFAMHGIHSDAFVRIFHQLTFLLFMPGLGAFLFASREHETNETYL